MFVLDTRGKAAIRVPVYGGWDCSRPSTVQSARRLQQLEMHLHCFRMDPDSVIKHVDITSTQGRPCLSSPREESKERAAEAEATVVIQAAIK